MPRLIPALLIAIAAAAFTPAFAAEDFERHTLTPSLVASFNSATKELGALPAMKDEDDEDDAKDQSVADIKRKIDGIPAAKPILAKHGFTSQTYALTLMAYFQAAFHLGMEPSMDKKGSAELLAQYSKETRGNIEMLRKNPQLLKEQK